MSRRCLVVFLVLSCLRVAALRAEWVWVEGEKPAHASVVRHSWYSQVQRDQLSGGDLLSHYSSNQPGEAKYEFQASAAGEYDFWVRANPVQARMAYRLNGGEWTAIDFGRAQSGNLNIAADNKPDHRFIAWIKVGRVKLQAGANEMDFRIDSPLSNHGYLDCFVLINEAFQPQGFVKPDQIAEATKRIAAENEGWFPFAPGPDSFADTSGFDLRPLNEAVAGENGFIAVQGAHFVHSQTGRPLRFWAVNGPPRDLTDREALREVARGLAKRGVNLVRVHGGYFDDKGQVRMSAVKHAIDVVECMKAEGIYTHFSIYFPLWLRPKPNTPWLEGYDGTKHPFAALYFNKDFQDVYRSWWKAVLLTPSETTGKPLVAEPAVAGVEIINEDSYLFWTFTEKNIPDPQLRILESQFADWLKARYGSLNAALQKWKGPKVARDDVAAGRVGFRPLWNMFNEKTPRDQDTVRFLVESQRRFYEETYQFLRELGFRGVITASNWTTASPTVFGPLEKYSYTVGDFIDRHGYFGCNLRGENAEWSVREGHTYSDRSALRFDAEQPGKPKSFVHPVMDVFYDGKPSMISETTFCRPNRFRSEAPLFYAVYGALQDTAAIVHFSLDSSTWAVKPGFFMQPWTLMTPAMMGQSPAAALIYRRGMVPYGDVLVDLNLKIDNLLALEGTPLPQEAAFDELRLKDVPAGTELQPGSIIDPLVHFAGRTKVRFTAEGGPAQLTDLRRYIDRQRQVVTSSTGHLKLDYGKGLLTINAPAAQGLSGALDAAGSVELQDLVITSGMPLGHIVAVSLDSQPLGTARKILLQVMSEEKSHNFHTEPVSAGVQRITRIGQDPWLVKELSGEVRFRRADAAQLQVTALDYNGYPAAKLPSGGSIPLQPTTVYYLIQAP